MSRAFKMYIKPYCKMLWTRTFKNDGQVLRQLIHEIKKQCIFTVTKVYFKSNFYDNNNINKGRIALPEMRHPQLFWSLHGVELILYTQTSPSTILRWRLLQRFSWPEKNYSASFLPLWLTAARCGLCWVESKSQAGSESWVESYSTSKDKTPEQSEEGGGIK